MNCRTLIDKTASFSQCDAAQIQKALNEAADKDFAAGAACIAIDLGLDAGCAAAAILQASAEYDDSHNEEQIKQIAAEYGEAVALLVEGVRKVSGVSAKGKTLAEAESIRKMLFALVNDIRILFIKLADRLQTLRCIDSISEEQKKKIAAECLDIYAPLAARFGVSWLKDELEDLSLKNLNREAFNQIKEIVSLKKAERQKFLDTIQLHIKEEAEKNGMKIEVYNRAKHFYSIYQKMRKLNKRAEDIFDLFGIRILCDTIESCYTLLGMIHTLWKPLDGRFKDYIAMPKSNGYQSLHTTVMTGVDSGTMENYIEVQIRTFEMHKVAEHGIASHWLYKKGLSSEMVSEKYLPVINKFKDLLSETSDSFFQEVKREILQDSIFVFTPQGKVVELPTGATPLDFAYSIHSAIGEHCSLAKADGKIISLRSPLQNTQVVEIATSQAAHPHKNWLAIVRTAKARNKIRQWLLLNDSELIAEKKISEKKKKEHTAGSAKDAAANKQPDSGKNIPGAPIYIRVQDEKNFLVRFAKCCNPQPGMPITGFISRGRGIIIHRQDCCNLAFIKEFEQRKIDAEWDC